MKIKKYVKKASNKFHEDGLKTLIVESGEYIKKESKKIKPSYDVAMSKNHIIVNWSNNENSKKNFGDALNPLLVTKLSGKKIYHYSNIINIRNKPVYSVIGSILDRQDIENLEVWGSGFMSGSGKFIIAPKKVHAVRGPLTRDLILKQGIDCPEVYGDPALLAPMIYKPTVKKKYKLGIIPHYVDKNNKYIEMLKKNYKEEVFIIDIEDKFRNVIDNVNKCEVIISSSLHGIIIADAYNVPSLWVKFSDGVLGEGFKFRDYMLSVERKQLEPVVIDRDLKANELLNSITEYKIKFDPNRLLSVCPFLEI